ncbi:MAG: NAD(P)/FAD-dependent oxidoreductase [Gemmatimonadota bacterium]
MTRRAPGGGTVCVLGGGIAGLTVALALRDRGCEVTVVEARDPVAGATAASAGMIAPLYESADWDPLVRLGVRSGGEWPDFAARIEKDGGRSVGWRRTGMLVRNATEAEHGAALATAGWQAERGLRAEVVSERGAEEIQPGLGPGAVSYLWLEGEALVDPRALREALPRAARAAGVRLRTGTGEGRLEIRAGRAAGVRTREGSAVAADAVVVACGAGSGRVDGLPRTLPVRPVRGQMLALRPAGPAPRVIVADHAGRYAVPRRPDLVVAGSTMEEAGFRVEVTEPELARIRRAVEALAPGLATAVEVERWAGLRPVAADGLPVIGPDPEVPGLHYATGYGRRGILLAPLAGRAVAEGIVGGRPGDEWAPFRPGRFTGTTGTPG